MTQTGKADRRTMNVREQRQLVHLQIECVKQVGRDGSGIAGSYHLRCCDVITVVNHTPAERPSRRGIEVPVCPFSRCADCTWCHTKHRERTMAGKTQARAAGAWLPPARTRHHASATLFQQARHSAPLQAHGAARRAGADGLAGPAARDQWRGKLAPTQAMLRRAPHARRLACRLSGRCHRRPPRDFVDLYCKKLKYSVLYPGTFQVFPA